MLIDTETVRNKGSFLTPGVIAVMVFPDPGESQFVPNIERKNIKSSQFVPNIKERTPKKQKRIQNNEQEPKDFHTSEKDQGCQR